jgi:D-serine deaminase-like pyridoxal phosphate-dependent protein
VDIPFDPDLIDDTPSVVIDLGRLRANVETAAQAAAAHGVRLRPHAKTHKMLEVAQLQLDAGAIGLQVAKLGEAEVFADGGVVDIFVGYPIVGRAKLRRLTELAARCRISVAVDSLAVAAPLSELARTWDQPLPVMLEVDTGGRRTGAASGEAAVDLARRIDDLEGLTLVGVFTHEGHVYAAGDSQERETVAREACAALVEAAELIRSRGIDVATVSVGSTPSFPFAVACPSITEARPGTYVFNDRLQLELGSATLDDVAAFVVATVVARPAPDRVVIDAGSKVLTSDPARDGAHGALLGSGGAVVTRLSEEHGVVEVSAGSELEVGQRVVVVPNHICPVINLADSVDVVEGGAVVDRWRVAARGRVA